jgi:hypothetical protein
MKASPNGEHIYAIRGDAATTINDLKVLIMRADLQASRPPALSVVSWLRPC